VQVVFKKNLQNFAEFSGKFITKVLTLFHIWNKIVMMKWEVEYTDEFEFWWDGLSDKQQGAVDAGVRLIEDFGPALKYPYSTGVKSSRYGNMRELRSQSEGNPLRTFYAFDPRRTAILLIGGDKTGDDRFYVEMVPRADAIYEEYLKELKEEEK
jgi:hypothetical protein